MSVPPSEVEVTRLANGVTVATHAMPHLQSVAAGLWVGAGARSESASEHGICHLLEHMAFKGTARRTAFDIAETIEAVGGEINAETSVDHTAYFVRLLKDDLALGIDVLADVVTAPLLDPEELRREQHVVAQEIGAADDVPEDCVFDRFQEAAFPDQAIGRSILGTEASVAGHTAAALRDFLGRHYRGPQVVLAAAGALYHDEVVALAERSLEAFGDGRAAADEQASYGGGVYVEPRDVQEAQILLGFAGPSLADRDLHAGHLLSAILGGGMASRLFQEVREERGLCYAISSFYWPYSDTGLFGVHAAASGDDLPELLPVIAAELRKLVGGVPEPELARARAQLRAGLLMTLESPLARAGQIARHILLHGRPIPLTETLARIDAVTSADLAAIAERIVATEPTLAAIGPVATLPPLADIRDALAGGGRLAA